MVAAVNEMEEPATDPGRKILQKIMIIGRLNVGQVSKHFSQTEPVLRANALLLDTLLDRP